MEKYKYQAVENDVTPEVISFLDEVLPFPYSKSTFEWEYSHPKKVFWTAHDQNNVVVGSQGMIPIVLNYKGDSILSAKSETSYLSESAKGQGVFKTLYQKVVEETFNNDIDMIWGLTSLGGLWQKLGFKAIDNCLIESTLPLRANKYYRQRLEGNSLKKQLKTLRWFLKSTIVRLMTGQSGKELNIYTKIRDEKDLEHYHNQSKSKITEVNIVLSKAYVDYRINRNPFLQYEFLFSYGKNDQLNGYAIYSISDNVANLVAIEGENTTIKKSIINKLIKALIKKKSVYKINVFGNKQHQDMKVSFDILKKYGAMESDTGLYFVFKDQNQGDLDIRLWNINGLWTEGIHL